jgi:hypothetical protein
MPHHALLSSSYHADVWGERPRAPKTRQSLKDDAIIKESKRVDEREEKEESRKRESDNEKKDFTPPNVLRLCSLSKSSKDISFLVAFFDENKESRAEALAMIFASHPPVSWHSRWPPTFCKGFVQRRKTREKGR